MVKCTFKNLHTRRGIPDFLTRSERTVNLYEIQSEPGRTENYVSVETVENYSAAAALAASAATFLASSFSTTFIIGEAAVSACFVLTVR